MKKILICFAALILSLGASAQNNPDVKDFLGRFEKFIVHVESYDSVPEEKWKEFDTDYKAYRDEYKNNYKSTISDDNLKTYTSLKTRYLKVIANKKVGRKIEKSARKLGSSIKGFVEGLSK